MIASFVVPGEPVAWARAGKNGKFSFTPPKQRNFGAMVKILAAEAMDGREPYDGPVKLLVDVCLAIPASKPKKWQNDAALRLIRPVKKPDWDNAGKIISDALNGIVWNDDAQVIEATVRKFYDLTPRVQVMVTA
ncbi:hypothetical protein BSL82_09625 [Tardibacter chloracetimidivorans]|uniref:Uncharacterized protein n=1 Tax=Tardibacter chloracetimidivorans TaxID=1921510 RepID=A0A1L3ZVB7_9SPHN|nr:RusA family crossover junction endodeoxyribonuclease [Tardibacter chloracetimidivorans]API59540.1 hypothetical protein BSL82_09625 [Tardibacter chloracetimidivorans]